MTRIVLTEALGLGYFRQPLELESKLPSPQYGALLGAAFLGEVRYLKLLDRLTNSGPRLAVFSIQKTRDLPISRRITQQKEPKIFLAEKRYRETVFDRSSAPHCRFVLGILKWTNSVLGPVGLRELYAPVSQRLKFVRDGNTLRPASVLCLK